MTSKFFTKASDINLNGPPWLVTDVLSVYVLNDEGELSLWKDDACTNAFDPPQLDVQKEVSTGLYFHIASGSEHGTEFSDGLDNNPPPLTWEAGSYPSSVTPGKFEQFKKAFSLKDYWNHSNNQDYSFTLNIKMPDGSVRTVALVDSIDPTIVERGEEPPPETRED